MKSKKSKKKGELGIFISDASFRKKEKISVISVKCNTTGMDWTKTVDTSSSLEAEKAGIRYAINRAQNHTSFYNAIFICDNKEAVLAIKEEYEKRKIKPFRTAQFLWLPRKYLGEADFLTKNLGVKVSKEVKKLKTNKLNRTVNTKTKRHINSIAPDKSVLLKRYKQFQAIKGNHYKSTFFTLKKPNIEKLQDLYISEIDVVCEDIENTIDPLERGLANLIAETIFEG